LPTANTEKKQFLLVLFDKTQTVILCKMTKRKKRSK